MNKQEKEWIEKVYNGNFSREQIEQKLNDEVSDLKKRKELINYYDKLKRKNSIDSFPNQQKQKKSFWQKLFSAEKLQKSGKVLVVYLKDNALADLKELDVKDDQFFIEGKAFHVDRDCMYSTKKERIPLAIIREWDLIPLGTKRWYETEGKDEKLRERFSQLEKHVLRGIKNVELYKALNQGGGNYSAKQIILWVIVAFVIGAVAIGYL